MAKKNKEKQLPLIDVEPENMKEILGRARLYKEAQTERIAWLVQEKEHKQAILTLVKEAELKPLENGVIRFHCDGVIISITPRDELVQVKEDSAEE